MFIIKRNKLSNYNINKVTNIYSMFSGCSNELKLKIRCRYKNFQEIAFDDDNSDDNIYDY